MKTIRCFLNSNTYVHSIRQGLLLTIPFLFIGSSSLAILNLPITPWQDFLSSPSGSILGNLLLKLYDITMGVLSLFFLLTISYSYGEKQETYDHTRLFFPAVSLGSFLIFCYPAGGLSIWGPDWTFTALCIALFSCFLMTKFYQLIYRRQRLYAVGAAYNFNASMASLIPAASTIVICGLLGSLLSALFSDTNITNFGSYLLVKLFAQIPNGMAAALLYIAISHLLWFFGIHGTNMLEAIPPQIFDPVLSLNQSMAAQGIAPTGIYSKTFLDAFVFMGGSGCSLCLIAALFLVAKKKNYRRQAYMSSLSVVFNINELLLFGLPIIFSADMIIPFILTPIVLTLISSFFMSVGLVPVAVNEVQWTVPALFSGYLATGSPRGTLLQLFNLAVGTMIYIPFIKHGEKVQDREMGQKIAHLKESLDETNPSVWMPNYYWNGHENQQTAKILSSDLRYAISTDSLKLYYQPQLKSDGTLYGCESLLRWNYEERFFIYPPLIVVLAAQSQLTDQLGFYIIRKACHDMKQAQKQLGFPVSFSVNVLPLQLEREGFADQVLKILEEEGIQGNQLIIELTEQVALSSSPVLEQQLEQLKNHKIRISMDDFGMGHGSLNYLNNIQFDEVKIDGSLVRRIPESAQTLELIGNIIHMAQILNLETVAECVETKEQIDLLDSLNCHAYQGYYYSRPLPLEDFITYVKEIE